MWSNNANRTVQREFADKLTKEIKMVLGEDVDIKRVAGGLRVASGSRTGFGTTLDVLLGSGGIYASIQGDFTTAAGSALAAIISSATIQNPKVAARIAQTFGASEEVADKISDNIKTLKKAVEAKGLSVEGLSAGAALTFLAGGDIDSEPTEEKPTMTQLLSRAQQERSRANQPVQ
jgi:sulfite reductase alpha subunit-like flavoprotein